MTRCSIVFYGDDRGDHGMPTPFHYYMVHATDLQMGFAVAVAVPITEGSQRVDPVNVKGGEQDAVDAMQQRLRNIHRGMKVHIDCT